MTYQELRKYFRHHESTYPESHLTAYITFSSFGAGETRTFSNRGRTYAVSSNCKAYLPTMGGYSIFGTALDGSDNGVRLDYYMQEERAEKDGWQVEDCCILAYLLTSICERDIPIPQIFYSADDALAAMIDQLAKWGDLNRDLVWQAFQDADGDLENENFGVNKSVAWLNSDSTGNWDWDIQLLRIYSPTHIEVGDVMDG